LHAHGAMHAQLVFGALPA